MKKRFVLFNLILFCSLFPLICQETENLENESETSTDSELSEIETEAKKEGFLPQIVHSFQNLNLVYDEGVSYCQLTRIEVLDDRSNFVRENMMIGPFFQFQTVDFTFIDYMVKVSAYYPFYNAFNGMQQQTRNMFNYAINTYLGALYTDTQLGYINLNYSLGFHYMFQLTDEWYMHYVGLGGIAGLHVPLTKNWSLINNYFFSFDNPNIGANRTIQPFDAAYQFQIDLGVRYSKKVPNKVYIFSKKASKTKNQNQENL